MSGVEKQDYLDAYYQCTKQTIEEFMESENNEIEHSYIFQKSDGSKYQINIKLSFKELINKMPSVYPKSDASCCKLDEYLLKADVNRIICEYRDDAAKTGSERDLERAYGANAVGELISELPGVYSKSDLYIKEIDHLHKYITKLETQIIEQEPINSVLEDIKAEILNEYVCPPKNIMKIIDKHISGKE